MGDSNALCTLVARDINQHHHLIRKENAKTGPDKKLRETS